ncbi:MAG: IS3 family transposase, partial [Clostridia bacterium]|nr:IS3 family transposase [Clostridia bacterium]
QEHIYIAIEYLNIHYGYSVKEICTALKLNRSSYYKWKKRKQSHKELLNIQIAKYVKDYYEESDGVLGYRQMSITINKECTKELPHKINVKRVRRIMQILGLRSVIRRKRPDYIKSTPEITAENVLNRDFKAEVPFEKWLTDVTEFKYYNGPEIKKVYLSAILDLYDRRIIAYKIGDSNNNALVFETFDEATSLYPNAKPIFHSDRGFQYTNKVFHQKLVDAGMIQSMSRVGRCLDNAPMEGWWGILKSEMYYLKKFTSREMLVSAIEKYIHFYNTRRYQKRLNCMSPCEYYFSTAA